MEKLDLEAMPLDDLWALHEQISSILSKRIIAEKRQLENRLLQLNRGKDALGSVKLKSEPEKTNRERPRRNIQESFPNIRILTFQPKRGPVGVSGLGG